MEIVDKDFNKLVRDGVVGILKNEGAVVESRVLEGGEYAVELGRKLVEEAQEVAESTREHIVEEIGDVMTVINALMRHYGITDDELALQQKSKDEERGRFEERIFLIRTRKK
jgi:predicted house-cleaning noncanonical NTP pyrophosphatase (MazG superfamily)